VFATTVLFAAFAFILLNPPRSPAAQSPAFQLTSGTGAFTLAGTVDATPTGPYPTTNCHGKAVLLAPGHAHCLLYTVSNPLGIPITVTTITGSAVAFMPVRTTSGLPKCKTSDVAVTPFTGSLSVPPRGMKTVGVPVELLTDGNQDNCEGGTFTLDFQATAQFTDDTKTVLAAPGSGPAGSTVLFTATVTGTNPALDGRPPEGTVSFYRCASLTTCASPTKLGTTTVTEASGAARYETSSLPVGTTYVEAAYAGTGTNFNPSTSSIVPVVIQALASCVSAPTTRAHIVLKGTVKGNYVVPPFTSVWLDRGTITGTVTVPVLSSFSATGGTIGDDVLSAGEVSLQGTTVKGAVKAGGALAIGPGSSIGRDLTATVTLALCAVGTTSDPISVGGSVSAHGLPLFFPTAQLCGLTVEDNLTYSFNVAPVDIGGVPDCAGNVIGNSLVVEHNASSVTIGTNTVRGTIRVALNAGGMLVSNTAGQSCLLGPNFPPVHGSGNHALVVTTCNGRA
jgi:hypothetical protein